jgi:hypothetical protein
MFQQHQTNNRNMLPSFLKAVFLFFTSPSPSGLLVYGHMATELASRYSFRFHESSLMRPLAAVATSPLLLKSRFYHPLPNSSSLGKPSSSFLDVFFLLGTLLRTFCLSFSTWCLRSLPIADPDLIDPADEKSERDSAIQLDRVSCHVCFV